MVSISSIPLGVLDFNSLPLKLEGMHKISSYSLSEYDHFTKRLLNIKESRDSLEVTFPYIWPFSHFDRMELILVSILILNEIEKDI